MERRVAWLGIGLIAAGAILIAGSAAFARPGSILWGFGGPNLGSGPDPGSPGFVPGTTSAPRIVRIVASADLRFYPDTVAVKQGETIRFEVTSMGPITHEFMVGPAADVAADTPRTPEVADITMMQTKSLTYTFTGSGPFAYACHAPGHYEAGMRGTIVIAP